ncbi:LptF/LptG family permease [Stappia sp. F7233]|uniref:LptF/LptG family permease n=1 Tax=Stappia albiluteola TaxID=2758565 RepID=A0A839AIZ6_9HYPH|nr:LptF/LptG family permease [Stappia albiluteola]MBA5778737.1 LptF/LptG family permease [Stappia albiluteola]
MSMAFYPVRSERRSLAARLLTITGIAGRRALRLYLSAAGLVMMLFLVTAWSIDLAKNFDEVAEVAAASDSAMALVLTEYLFYRGVDIVTRLLPVACFIGLFVAEFWRLNRLESTILAAAGRSPLQTLTVVAVFGLIVGALQLGLEQTWRPSAVFAQVDLGAGSYAKRFKRGLTGGARWFVVGSDVLKARVKSDDEPELEDVELYRGATDGSLKDVIIARRAVPTGIPDIWQLSDVAHWGPLPQEKGEERSGSSPFYLLSHYKSLELRLQLLPVQLTYYGVPAFYLPSDALTGIDAARYAVKKAEIESAQARRVAAAFLPGSFALLGASLAPIAGAGRVRSLRKILLLVMCGYVALVTLKVFWALGELGTVPATVAAWTAIVAALGGTALAVLRQMRPAA